MVPEKLTENKRYTYYEAAVQDPDHHIKLFDTFYKNENNRSPKILREDFCGTYFLASEWVRSGADRRAVGVDLDPEPLQFGKQHRLKHLSLSQKKRLKTIQGDVMTVRTRKVDVTAACNFSFFTLKKREYLLKYFRNVYAHLSKNGIFALEMAGGPGFEETPAKESRAVPKSRTKAASKPWFQYCWEQQEFDHISREGRYAIHFKPHKGKWFRNAFVYDWRVWTLPEVSELLRKAGFSAVRVYLEDEDTAEFTRVESIDSEYETWICFVVAVK